MWLGVLGPIPIKSSKAHPSLVFESHKTNASCPEINDIRAQFWPEQEGKRRRIYPLYNVRFSGEPSIFCLKSRKIPPMHLGVIQYLQLFKHKLLV